MVMQYSLNKPPVNVDSLKVSYGWSSVNIHCVVVDYIWEHTQVKEYICTAGSFLTNVAVVVVFTTRAIRCMIDLVVCVVTINVYHALL